MAHHWSNWSGSVRCRPRTMATPDSEGEIAALVGKARQQNRIVRVAGSGHSFTPLCASNDVFVSLDRWTGIESADATTMQATIRAGTKLHDLGQPLGELDLALANQGDVDVQSLAGAVATGTHGTGHTLGSLSTQVVGLRLVTGEAELRELSADHEPDSFRAAQVSLGALGIVTAVRLQLVPAYRLHERLWRGPIDECLARLDERIAEHRHYEFFWYPRTDLAHHKALDPTEASPDELPDCEGERIDHSWRVFPSIRDVRFNETEFAVPAEQGPDCFRALRRLMRERYPDVTWPIEYRTIAADNIPLSPAFGRATVTLSLHQAAELPYREFFDDAATICRAHDGRPHWGKIHPLGGAELRSLYPDWDRFQEVRRRFDPQEHFLNEHLQAILQG